MITYRFTATLTKRPYSRKLKGTVRVMGDVLDALSVVREVIRDTEISTQDDGLSIKISITATKKKV